MGTVRGSRSWPGPYGAHIFCDQESHWLPIDTKFVYRELLKRVVEMFQTGKPPVEPAATLEMIAILEAATRSTANRGMNERLG